MESKKEGVYIKMWSLEVESKQGGSLEEESKHWSLQVESKQGGSLDVEPRQELQKIQ